MNAGNRQGTRKTAPTRKIPVRVKTTLTDASVAAFIDKLDNESRRADAHALVQLFTRVSGWQPRMWGSSIIGFGAYEYTYETGRTGTMCALGFSPRKANFALYVADFPGKEALLAKLGKHKGGIEQCLYINRVADVDEAVLGKILAGGLAQLKKKWPVSAACFIFHTSIQNAACATRWPWGEVMKSACLFVALCCVLASGTHAADATLSIRLATDAREVAIPLAPTAEEASDEQQYLTLIEQLEEAGDVAAPDLVEPLTALGDLYFARQDYDKAFESYASARQIMRVNAGFDTLPELPLIAKLVRSEEARGRVAEAWELEQSLVTLAERNAGRIETLPIFRELAEKRFAVWRLHRNGVIPPQIELGCYYARRDYNATMGAMVLTADNPGRRERCSAGDRPVAQLALLLEARSYQIRALDALLDNGYYASDEFWDQFMQVLDTSYIVMPRVRTYSDVPLANLMVRLLSYEPQDEAGRVRRAMILVHLADMNVMRARRLDRYVGFDTVREQYEQAYAVLQQEGVSTDELQELFAPALPVTLPAFRANPLATNAESGVAGYIDIAFEITRQGKSRRTEAGAMSANIERSQRRALERMISLTTFRPRLVDGMLVDNAPVSLRYYVGSALGPAADACVDADSESCEL